MSRERRAWKARAISWFRDGLIVLTVTFLLLVLLEGGLRLFLPQHLDGEPIRPGPFSVKDELLGSRYVPLAHWRFNHPEYSVEYAINRHGFRDEREHPVPKPEGRTRALLLGDSFTFGQGVNYEEVWTVIAERRLDSLRPNAVELVKVGLQGADQRTQRIMLDRLLTATESDVVIIVFLINDLYSNVPYEPPGPDRPAVADAGATQTVPTLASTSPDTAWQQMREQVFTRGGLLGKLHLMALARRIVTAFDAGYNFMYAAAPSRGGYLRLPLDEEPRRQLEITEDLFRDIAVYCRQYGKPLIVMSLPQQFQVLYRRTPEDAGGIDVSFYDRHFSQVAAEHAFSWIPLLDDFLADPNPRRLFYRLDGHLTPAGNELVARTFLEKVVPLIDSTIIMP